MEAARFAELKRRIEAADEFGPLHVLVSDLNVEDGHVQFCIRQAESEGDRTAADLAREVLSLSLDDRARLFGFSGYAALNSGPEVISGQ
jgi:hypothetical protein